jgi:hypothetical protein
MVQANEVEAWFKMQVWMLQYLIRDFKESDGAIIDALDPEVFKTRLLDEGWESDSNHMVFAPFATACFHIICKRYLEQTSSHLIGKDKSFVMARTSFGKHVKNPSGQALSSLLGMIFKEPSSALILELLLRWSLCSMTTTPATISGLSGLPASTSRTAIVRSLLVRFCSLSSTVTAFILLPQRRTLRLCTHQASMLATSFLQST